MIEAKILLKNSKLNSRLVQYSVRRHARTPIAESSEESSASSVAEQGRLLRLDHIWGSKGKKFSAN